MKWGRGEQDISRAITLYRQAAQAGMLSANTGWGGLPAGAGVKQDLREAFHWMELAAKNGDVPAMLKVGCCI